MLFERVRLRLKLSSVTNLVPLFLALSCQMLSAFGEDATSSAPPDALASASAVLNTAATHAHQATPKAHTVLHPGHAIKIAAPAGVTCIADSTIGQQLSLPIYEWLDKTKSTKGIIVAVPGMTLYAYSYNDLAKHLALEGYHVYSLDVRGFGRWRTESTKFGGNDKIEIGQSQQDLLDLVTDLRQAHPHQKLFMMGESLAGC